MGALLLVAPRRWPVALTAAGVAEIAVDLGHGIGLWAALGYAVANTVQPLVGAAALERWRGRTVDLGRLLDLGAFLVCAVVLAPLVGAVLGATTSVVIDDGSGWGSFLGEWWMGDGLGVLVIGAAILSLRRSRGWSRRGLAEGLVLGGVCALGAIAVFWLAWLPAVFVPVTLLLVIGFRLGARAVSLVGTAVAFVAAEATSRGHVYWDSLDITPDTGVLYLQAVLALVIATSLAVAAEMGERERALVGRAAAESATLEAAMAARRAERLRVLAERLSEAATARQVGEAFLRQALAQVDASAGGLMLTTPGGDTVELAAFLGERTTARWRTAVARDPRFFIPAAVLAGAPVAAGTRTEVERRFPGTAENLGTDAQAVVAVPLRAFGTTIGAFGLVFDRETAVSEADLSLLGTMASICGPALERARSFDAEARARIRAEVLQRNAARLAAAVTAEDVAGSVVADLGRIGVSSALVLAARDGVLRVLASIGLPAAAIERIDGGPVDLPLPGAEAIRRGRVVEAPGSELRERFPMVAELAEGTAIDGAVSIPLRGADQRVVGAISVGLEDGHLDDDVRDVLAALAEQAGVALARVEGLELQLRFEDDRAESHALLALATDATRAGWVTWNLETGFVQWDDRGLEIMAFAESDDPTTVAAWVARIHPDDRALVEERARAAVLGHSRLSVEFRIANGAATRVVHVMGRFSYDADGGPLRGTALVYDITERRLLERALQESEERFRRTFENAPVGIAQADEAGTYLRVNRRMCEITGYTEDELLARTFQEITHPEDVATDEALARQVIEGARETYALEKRYVRKDGSIVWVDLEVSAARDESGALSHLIAVVEDVTARKVAEIARRESEERFRTMADSAPVMIWMTDTDDACVYLNRSWYEFTGQTPETGLGSGWQDAVHPDDRALSDEAMQAAIARREPVSVDYRVRRHDGEYRWAIDSATPRFDAAGVFLGFIGSVIDISERRRAEETLRESEARFRALFSSIDEGYCLAEIVLDAAGRPVDYRFLEVNPLFESMTGLENAVGRTALELVPDLEPHWIETYGRVALGGEPLRFDGGSEAMGRWFDVYVTPVEPRGRFALVFKDVSERKQAETALRDREAVERSRRRRAELLALVMGELEKLDGFASRARRLVELLVPRVADYATVELPESDDPVVALRHHDPAKAEVLRALRLAHRLERDDAYSAGRAAEGEEQLIAHISHDLMRESTRDDEALGLLEELGPHSHIAVPLDLGEHLRAALLVGLTDPARRPYSADDLSFVRELAARAGTLLASARLREEEHRIAVRLQRALLPDAVLEHPSVSVAARYEAGADVLEVGGDWYDSFRLPDGRLGIVVGDVVGHGLEAAATMGRFRTALAALAQHTDRPSRLLTQMEAFANGPNGSDFATACYAILDPVRGVLDYASAGHPPILMISPEGEASWLDEGQSLPLCAIRSEHRPEATVRLEPGSLLVLYSDGLVERRRERLVDGLERLRAAAVALRHETVDHICDSLIRTMNEHSTGDDDVVVLCVRFAGVTAGAFRRVFPARPEELAGLRAAVRAWSAEQRLSRTDERHLLLALGEAATNAIEHAYGGIQTGQVEVEIEPAADRQLRVSVRDHGTWKHRETGAVPGRGRGTGIIRALTEQLEQRIGSDGTTVTFSLGTRSRTSV